MTRLYGHCRPRMGQIRQNAGNIVTGLLRSSSQPLTLNISLTPVVCRQSLSQIAMKKPQQATKFSRGGISGFCRIKGIVSPQTKFLSR